MLKQENSPEDCLAAATRVTSKELADAVTALQSRKEVIERGLDGTIPIGEAVRDLGLEATSQEILAQVEAQRQFAETGRGRRLPRRLSAIAGAVAVSAVVLGGFVGYHLASPQPAAGNWSGIFQDQSRFPVNIILNRDGTADAITFGGFHRSGMTWTEKGHALRLNWGETSSADGVLSDDAKTLHISFPSDYIDPNWTGGTANVTLKRQ